MALENQTPAQVAGIGVKAKNKWLAMLTETVKEETNAPKSLNM
jgi:hypothetical protein